jgi:hypothetical protein
LNRKLFAAEQFDGCAVILIVFALFPFFLPVGKEDPAGVEQRDSNHNRGIEQRVFPDGFGIGIGIRKHF